MLAKFCWHSWLYASFNVFHLTTLALVPFLKFQQLHSSNYTPTTTKMAAAVSGRGAVGPAGGVNRALILRKNLQEGFFFVTFPPGEQHSLSSEWAEMPFPRSYL